MTNINQFDIWVADLEPGRGTEPGKLRPVVIVQSDILNREKHSSTIICPLSSQSKTEQSTLRIRIEPDDLNGLQHPSYILSDQIRAIDNNRLEKSIGRLNAQDISHLHKTLKAILSLY